MKKALKGLFYFVLVAIVPTNALARNHRHPRYAPGNVNLKVQNSVAKVERGRRLAAVLCVGCHLDLPTMMYLWLLVETRIPQETPNELAVTAL